MAGQGAMQFKAARDGNLKPVKVGGSCDVQVALLKGKGKNRPKI